MDEASRYHPRAEQEHTDTKAQHSPLTLPQELYDDAMANIDPDRDVFTLYSCALVCRAWVPGTRRFTHHTLRIPCHITPREIELFNLLDSPHCTLFPTVRKVIFDGTPARLGIAPPDDEWMWPFTRLQTRFTGVRALDDTLAGLVVFFTLLTDGRDAPSLVFSLWFVAQLAPPLVLTWWEASRAKSVLLRQYVLLTILELFEIRFAHGAPCVCVTARRCSSGSSSSS